VGKVLLAYAPADVQGTVHANLTRIPPYTVTAPGRPRLELRRVHRDGFAQTSEEMSLGACSVAVPIFEADGRVEAALGIVVPTLKRVRAGLVSAADGGAGHHPQPRGKHFRPVKATRSAFGTGPR